MCRNCVRPSVLQLEGDPQCSWCSECGRCRIAQCQQPVAFRVQWGRVYLDLCADHSDSKPNCHCAQGKPIALLRYVKADE